MSRLWVETKLETPKTILWYHWKAYSLSGPSSTTHQRMQPSSQNLGGRHNRKIAPHRLNFYHIDSAVWASQKKLNYVHGKVIKTFHCDHLQTFAYRVWSLSGPIVLGFHPPAKASWKHRYSLQQISLRINFLKQNFECIFRVRVGIQISNYRWHRGKV